MWSAADGLWLGAPAGVIHEDNTVKPVFGALEKLIHKEWATEETLITDETGKVSFKGFRGGYTLSYEGGAEVVPFKVTGAEVPETVVVERV